MLALHWLSAAGVLPGDELLSIDGQDTSGLDGVAASKKLRGTKGSTVRARLPVGVSG